MSIDRDSTYALAQKYVQRGQLDRAIVEFERLMADDPADLRTLQRIGDLELKRGNTGAARQRYREVADAYVREGFLLKAVAVFKQLSQLDPDDLPTANALAALYEKLELFGDAIEQWRTLFALYEAKHNWPEALEIAVKLRQFDPSPAAGALRVAKMQEHLGRKAEAVTALSQTADALWQNQQHAEWLQVAEPLLALDPALAGLACRLAKHYMNEQRPKEALAKLRLAFQAAPQDQDVLRLLAEAFEALAMADKAVAIWRELLGQAQQRGQMRATRRALENLVRLVPDDADSLAHLRRLTADEAHETILVRHHGAGQAGTAPSQSPLTEANLAATVAEAEVFLRYHLPDRARRYLDRVLQTFPDHEPARALLQICEAEQARRQALWAKNPVMPEPRAPFVLAKTTFATAGEPVFLHDAPSVVAVAEASAVPFALADPSQADVAPTAAGSPAPDDADMLLDLDAALALAPADPIPSPAPSKIAHDALRSPAVAEDEPRTLYELGVQYRESGLFDDAIATFERVTHDAGLAAQALSQIGLCHRQANRHREASEAFTRGLALPGMAQGQRWALTYELAVSQHALGDTTRARALLAQVAEENSGYRDVTALMQAWTQAAQAGGSTP